MAGQGTLTKIPEAEHHLPPTSEADLDEAVAAVEQRKKDWVALDVPARIALIDEMVARLGEEAEAWAKTDALLVKKIPASSPLTGEGWLTGPVVMVANLRAYRRSLEQILELGRPQPPGLRTRADGRVVADVFPATTVDKISLAGISAELRFDAGLSEQDVLDRMARVYRPGGKDDGGVCLVLGAGNVSSIGPTDVTYKLFVEDRVCVLKMNPVNEQVGPHIENVLAPLIREGFVRVVYGGGREGAYLTNHPLIDEVHITGSDKTHDVIVFGPGEEGESRKQANDPLLKKPISSELGNITPIIVVPGPWTEKDLRFHGDNLASMVCQNGGFNCIAGRVIIQHRSWSQRDALMSEVRRSMRAAEQRAPYYPGARDRWQTFVDAHPEAEIFGTSTDGEVPFTLISDVDTGNRDDVVFNHEVFCGILSEVALDAPTSVPQYLEQAVNFCNERLWGTLACSLIVHPKSLEDPAIAAAVEQAIDDLEYGNVSVNLFSGVPFGVMGASWGAYPGHTLDDIGSGVGVVHNSFMFEGVTKGVVRGPFRMPMTPPWFHNHRRLDKVMPLAFRLQAFDDYSVAPKLVYHSLRG